MITKHQPWGRRALPALALGLTVALIGGFAVDAATASAQTTDAQQAQSENWAGYAVQSKSGANYSSVSASWTEPSVSADSGQGYSAFWVGLGGASGQSQALEQVGTAAEVDGNGQTSYYAWYELVPSPETKLDLDINPGDQISAKVTVDGTNVTVSLSDQTTGKSVTKSLQMSNPDTSSAEWIAEAPSAESENGNYQVLPLANFGTVTFTGASATAGGHTGSISDADWSAQAVQLSSSSTTGLGGPGGFTPTGIAGADASAQSSAGASPSDVSSDGSTFSVSYSASAAGSQASGDGYGSGGYGGYGYGGYGYGGYGSGGYAYDVPGAPSASF
jgi:Peptidase A4 family